MTLETMKVIGTTPLRRDGIDKVTGAARFADDIHLPRMLHGKTLRSPYPHARIVSIDTSRALALPGVHKVVSGIDFPVLPPTIVPHGAISTVDMKDYADNCMAKGRVLYDGHVLAAVAADSPHIAEEAVRLIDVTYEQLEYVMDVQEAMAEGAPVIHEHFTPGAFIKQSKKTLPNAGQVQVALGDVDEGFDSADIIIEREFKTKNVHQGYIEPHSVTVTWGKNDQINVWTSTQGHFAIREHIAIILKHPLHKIKVTPMEIGGGFGGKDVAYLEPVAAVLSRETGRPVKMAMSRAEMLRGTGPSPATYIKVKLGAKRDGTLIAADLHLAYEAGAFPGGPVACAMLASTSRYRIPHVIVNGFDVLLNKPKMKQYRAPGGVPINFAVESCMDILAAEIEMSPLAFRLKNVMVEGDRMITDMPCQRIGGIEILETIQEHPHYTSNLCKPNQGRGLGFAFWFGASCHSSAIMTLNEDGTVQVATGNPDLSGTRMTLAMQAAEALGR
jgi:xanthine dehydrogenase molybdenum-binding subunit